MGFVLRNTRGGFVCAARDGVRSRRGVRVKDVFVVCGATVDSARTGPKALAGRHTSVACGFLVPWLSLERCFASFAVKAGEVGC